MRLLRMNHSGTEKGKEYQHSLHRKDFRVVKEIAQATWALEMS